ncbi:hypothetical protein JCM3775_004459 [Rhodotorula graminis]
MTTRTTGLLPAELWDHVLSLLPPHDQQHTALALSRALPRADPSPTSLVRHIRITRPRQALQAAQALRKSLTDSAQATRTVTVEVWRDDQQLVVNLLLAIPRPTSVSLTVGPLAAPEHLEDLVDPASIHRSGRWRHLEQLSFRFNPYSVQKSYHTFLKGAYYDTAPLSLARCDPQDVPALRRLSFIQDLPPTYGVVRKETPAFGLADLDEALGEAAAGGDAPASDARPEPEPVVYASVGGKFGRVLKHDKMDFAQPIVFFQLGCITHLALSPLAAQLSHVTLRIPRRALLPALVDLAPTEKRAPFPALRHLDLSTTHVADDARVPTLLRLYPALESLVLDRCSGLVGQDAVDEATAHATLKWLGKCCGGSGLSRADEALRVWRRISKARPTDAPAPSPSAPVDSPISPVRDLVVLPPIPTLRTLGLGLHSRLDKRTVRAWEASFDEGYGEAVRRAGERAEDGAERWARWERSGRLDRDRDARVAVFADQLELGREGGLPVELVEALRAAAAVVEPRAGGAAGPGDAAHEPDPVFLRFCTQRNLVPLSPSACPSSLISSVARALSLAYSSAQSSFALCLTPDCSDRPGRAHLVVGPGGGAAPEDAETRAERERRAWSEEREEEWGVGGWRRGREEHKERCAHLEGRKAWALSVGDDG